MLALSRKQGQEIWIDERIQIVVKKTGGRVVLLIKAPPEIRIRRGEIKPHG